VPSFLIFFGSVLDGFHDVVIARASAKVARDAPADFVLGRVGIVREQIGGAHNHAGCAKAALQAVLFFEAFLQGMELAALGHAFDGQHFLAVGLHGEHVAGFHGAAIEQYGAGTAVGCVAADVRTGEGEVAADGGEVAHRRVGNHFSGIQDNRVFSGDEAGFLQLRLACQGADFEKAALFPDVRQSFDSADVYDALRRGEPQFYHRYQAVSAVRPLRGRDGNLNN
jgi:hypothetical protein